MFNRYFETFPNLSIYFRQTHGGGFSKFRVVNVDLGFDERIYVSDALDSLLVIVMFVVFMIVSVIHEIRVIEGTGDSVKCRLRRLCRSPKHYSPPISENISKP